MNLAFLVLDAVGTSQERFCRFVYFPSNYSFSTDFSKVVTDRKRAFGFRHVYIDHSGKFEFP